MKNIDPLMGAKFKSKTHLLNKFFLSFEPFFAHLASKFSKSDNMTASKAAMPKGEGPQAASIFSPRKFCHVHVDLVGPLPASSDVHVYLLTIMDRSTRWVEAIPLCNMEANTCIDAFVANWAARFGVLAMVTTDWGAQFTSALWMGACTSLGIKHVLTTAHHHPRSNGMVECVHRQIKDALRAHGAGPTWHSHLPRVLMGLRAVSKQDSAASSAELVNGSPLILPGQLLYVPYPPSVNVPAATHEACVLCSSVARS
jgi:hypothetical protein